MPPPIHGAAMIGKYIHDSKNINETFDCYYTNLATAANINDFGKWSIRKIFKIFLLIIRIIRQVRSVRPDLVYVTPNATGTAFFRDFIIIMILKILHCKIALHYHNKGVINRQKNRLYIFLKKCLFKNVKVILLAEQLYYDVKKYIKYDDVYICPDGIPDINQKIKKPHSGFNILFLSNMMEEKGVYTLLDACKILKKKNLYFHCDFVGQWSDVTEKKFNKYLDTNQLADKVTAHGAKYGDDKNEFFALADLFVFPTYYHNETFGLVLLEAMKNGIACIACDEGGIPNIIDNGKTGFIVPKKDAKAIADKIEYMYDHPEANKQMGDNGYQKFKEKFTLSVFERRFNEILLDIMQ